MQRSMKAGRASALSASPPQAATYCHSWASVRFILSTLPFCQGLKGRAYLCLTPHDPSNALKSPLR